MTVVLAWLSRSEAPSSIEKSTLQCDEHQGSAFLFNAASVDGLLAKDLMCVPCEARFPSSFGFLHCKPDEMPLRLMRHLITLLTPRVSEDPYYWEGCEGLPFPKAFFGFSASVTFVSGCRLRRQSSEKLPYTDPLMARVTNEAKQFFFNYWFLLRCN